VPSLTSITYCPGAGAEPPAARAAASIASLHGREVDGFGLGCGERAACLGGRLVPGRMCPVFQPGQGHRRQPTSPSANHRWKASNSSPIVRFEFTGPTIWAPSVARRTEHTREPRWSTTTRAAAGSAAAGAIGLLGAAGAATAAVRCWARRRRQVPVRRARASINPGATGAPPIEGLPSPSAPTRPER